MTGVQLTELVYLLHRYGSDSALLTMASHPELHIARGPELTGSEGQHTEHFGVQAEIALVGLRNRKLTETSTGVDGVVLQYLTALFDRTALPKGFVRSFVMQALGHAIGLTKKRVAKQAPETRHAFASAAGKLATRLRLEPWQELERLAQRVVQKLETWAEELDTGKPKPKNRAPRKKRKATA